MDVMDLKRNVEDLEKHIQSSQRALDHHVVELQKMCDHPHDMLRECSYVPHSYLRSMPPMRVCTICGAWEEGWGCGYETLKSEKTVPVIPRDDLYKLRRGSSQ